ncbi:iron reductase [Pyrrhoderma noxium]|uniref:Iron reductase n=1 Tax=Pyrrhoderma noxium TaxID=2282107 RepID=A0A286UDW7_9AGAM|nr:iron reductase [Pyrrhoderma noxium]
MLVGVGYERLNFFHRFVGVVSFLCGLGHVVGYTYKWVIAGTFTSHLSTPYIQCGLLSFLGLTILFLFSLPLIRTFAYNLFLLSHIIGLGLYLGAICYHQAGTTHYVVLALVIYALDHVFRVVKTRVGWAWCTPVPALGVTRVEVKGIRSGWRAGQHVRIRVLTTQFGGGGGGGGSSGSGSGGGGSEGEGMVLFVKKAGKWTNGLYDAASGEPDFFESNGRVESGFGGGVLSTSSSSSNSNPFSNGGPPYIATSGRTFRVLIEGPYGGPNDTVFSSFTGVMLIGGGSGITFPLSVCEEVVAGVRAGRSCVRFVEVVWVTKGREDVGELIPIFRRLLGRDGAGGGGRRRVGLKISVYYSRASGSGEKRNNGVSVGAVGGGDGSGGDGIDASIKSLEPDLVLCSGRPRLSNVISSLVDVVGQVGASTSTSGSGAGGVNGVVVGVCGPAGLGRDVKEAVRGLDGGRKRACGGVEVHEEIFGW